MTGRIRRLKGKHGAALGSVAAAAALQGLLLVSGVLAARILGPDGRGYLALLMLVPMGVSQLVGLGLPIAVVYAISRRPQATAATVRSLLRPALIQAVAILVLQAALLWGIMHGRMGGVQVAALLSLSAGPAIFGHHLALGILQGQQCFRSLNLVRPLPYALYSVSLILVWLGGLGSLEVIVATWAGTYTVGAGAMLIMVLRGLPSVDSRETPMPTKEVVRFGLKGMLGWASPIESFRLDQAAVGLFVAPAALGLYVAGLAFTNLPRFVAQSLGIVAYPRVAAQPDQSAAHATLWRFVLGTSVVCLVLAGSLAATVRWLLPFFFGPEFSGAVALTQILLGSAVLMSIRRILTDASRGLGLVGLGSVSETVSWALLLPLLPLLSLRYGAVGAALALVASSTVSLAVQMIGVLRHRGRATPAVGAVPPSG